MKMKRKNSFGQIIITVMFVYSAILCHFHASGLREQGENIEAYLYWFFCFTALAGSLRFQLANLIEKFLNRNRDR
tara:strand:+ start:65 stop:289 length:225 start_codon:yes stop_codon:yes gene_type:complete